jgi:hypothetical protein
VLFPAEPGAALSLPLGFDFAQYPVSLRCGTSGLCKRPGGRIVSPCQPRLPRLAGGEIFNPESPLHGDYSVPTCSTW